MVFLIFLLTVVVIAFRASTPEQRTRLFNNVLAALRRGREAAARPRPQLESFRDALRSRTRWVFVTPALVVLNVTIFVLMLFGPGAFSDPATLVAWGGNVGPRTTNGEWWRLVTTTFVHSGMLHLLVDLAGLIQLGLILERLVGPFAFAVVYVAAGVLASLVSLIVYPVAVGVGASGAIFGMYGLLLAWLIWTIFQRSTITVPLIAIRRLSPAAAVFVLYNMTGGALVGTPEIAGLAVGVACGLALTIGVTDRKPPMYRTAAAALVAVAIAVASTFMLHGVADVRPEIERVVAAEQRTAGTYQTAVDRFRKGRIGTEALVELIDRTIVPELHASRARLKAIDGVPREQQPLVAGADEYFRLRDESWRLRVEGLRKPNMLKLRQAENAERASLEALQKIKPGDQQ